MGFWNKFVKVVNKTNKVVKDVEALGDSKKAEKRAKNKLKSKALRKSGFLGLAGN